MRLVTATEAEPNVFIYFIGDETIGVLFTYISLTVRLNYKKHNKEKEKENKKEKKKKGGGKGRGRRKRNYKTKLKTKINIISLQVIYLIWLYLH